MGGSVKNLCGILNGDGFEFGYEGFFSYVVLFVCLFVIVYVRGVLNGGI